MPFDIPDHSICVACPHGYCTSYIREASRRMKDRDTQFRIAQNALMACAFDAWIPGLQDRQLMEAPLDDFVSHAIDNARHAGEFLASDAGGRHFGVTEQPFHLTAAQIGKVRGDMLETLCRAILWNCSAYTVLRAERSTHPALLHLEPYLRHSENIPVAVVSLGDSYDLARLFTPEDASLFRGYLDELRARDTILAYSTPDTIAISLVSVDDDVRRYFGEPILDLGIGSQRRLRAAVPKIEGKIRPRDLLFAAAIKTSIRSDRLYQFLFEANAWKFIWRRIFGLDPSKFYSIMVRVYGANFNNLKGVDFSSVGAEPENAERAIDDIVRPESARDLVEWFGSVLPRAADRST